MKVFVQIALRAVLKHEVALAFELKITLVSDNIAVPHFPQHVDFILDQHHVLAADVLLDLL